MAAERIYFSELLWARRPGSACPAPPRRVPHSLGSGAWLGAGVSSKDSPGAPHPGSLSGGRGQDASLAVVGWRPPLPRHGVVYTGQLIT